MGFDYAVLSEAYTEWIDYPTYELGRDFSKEEYELRLARARALMAQEGLDALVITTNLNGQWFTSFLEPHEWHDRCQARSAWFILTPTDDYLYMTPTACGEHFNTTRRSTWVTHIRAIVERAHWPRYEIWDIAQMPWVFAELGLERGRLGFELGDCMTMGITFNDFMRLRELMPNAQLVDGSPVMRRLRQIPTPEEESRVRKACQAGVWMHEQVTQILRPGMTEREFQGKMEEAFAAQFGKGYAYQVSRGWDVRNPEGRDSSFFHSVATDREFRKGDTVCRLWSGVSYRGYGGDVDRVWHVGEPPEIVSKWYRVNWECVRAMEEAIKPGNTLSDVYAACARVEKKHGMPERPVGRVGHGMVNTSGLSVHPDNHTVLEPGMLFSCEPMFCNEWGFYDLEDQFVVTETGYEKLHKRAPEQIPTIQA
jgi:Xaa-Pro aminopeptidase